MVKKLFTLFLLGLFCMTATAGERFLVRVGADGKQEAIPLKKGERAQDAVARLENARTSLFSKPSSANGLIDTLKQYPGVANDDVLLTSNFGWNHQDVAFIWFVPAAGGKVKEIWWRNYSLQGDIKKGTIRAWYANPKVDQAISASVLTKYIGYYKDPTDGDGLVTPYMPATGDQWFYKNGAADSTLFGYDPLGTEVSTWLPGGLQVTLDSGKWQGIVLESWGDSMFVKLGEKFGFTLSNDTKVSDIPPADPVTGARMEILSYPNGNPAPFHSYKWYETGRNSATDKGWHLRGDYEWGMYTVIEYTTDRAPKVELVGSYNTTLKTTTRPIEVKVTDDNPGGGPFGVASVRLFTKKGALASYDSALVAGTGSQYIGTAPAASPGDTVYWRWVATDVGGNRTAFGPRTYVVFKKNQANLLVYNNAQYSLGTSNLIYTSSSSKFDRWSGPTDGTGELDDLLAMYNNVIIADGSFPSRNVYPAVKTWFGKGTANAKKNLFFTSQDYGCYITPACGDTTFTAGSLEFDYLGVLTLGTQDLGPTNRPYKVVPLADTVTNYLIKYNKDSSTTLWHYPTFELAFSAYPDAMVPKAGAKALFTDGAGTNTLGVKNSGATFNSMFVAFDAGALQFRSDTALHNATYSSITDPKYAWIVDIGSLSVAFLNSVTSVKPVSEVVPGAFALGQNYPNPFNPTTTLEYSIPVRSNVEIAIFNILGQQVATVVNDMHDAGAHRATWNGKDSFGKPVASGIYFYQMRAGSFEQVKKMMLMK